MKGQPRTASSKRKRLFRLLLLAILVIAVVVGWQFLNARANSTDSAVAGRPLSNPHTHLHTVAWGGQPGVLYLGTHFGLFKSTDGGRTWPQVRGVLNTMMITSIAVSPSNSNALAVMAIPTQGVGQQWGVYFSSDGGNSLHAAGPPGLPLAAYPYTVRAGSGSAGHFYAFYQYAGWFETRDMGTHWYPITSGSLSNMFTPSLLTDPVHRNHLLLGGDRGLYESFDDGSHWKQITAVAGNVTSLVASGTTPRSIFCATDQGLYHWIEGSTHIARTDLPGEVSFTRLAISSDGYTVYGIAGQDLWYSVDSGATWKRRWHFERGDLISLVVDPLNSNHLYAGFFLPAKVESSMDGGASWQTLTG